TGDDDAGDSTLAGSGRRHDPRLPPPPSRTTSRSGPEAAPPPARTPDRATAYRQQPFCPEPPERGCPPEPRHPLIPPLTADPAPHGCATRANDGLCRRTPALAVAV